MTNFNKNASLLLFLCVNLLAFVDAEKIQIFSKHYDMFNGGSKGARSFWDEKYQKESVTLTKNYQWLSGGSGDLTDGYKELESSWKVKNVPYVGWNKKYGQIPDIDFFFDGVIAIDEIRISVDNPSSDGSVCHPISAIVGGVKYSFPGPDSVFRAGYAPYEAVIQMDAPIIDDQVRVTLISKCDWVLVSEVEFYTVDSDGDGVLDGIDECAFTTEPDVSCNDIAVGRFCWNGNTFVTRDDKTGDIISVGSYTLELTRGCSCDQILDKTDNCSENDCNEKGCTSDKLNEWIVSKVIYTSSGTTKKPTNVQTPTRPPSKKPTLITNSPTRPPSKKPTNSPTRLPVSKPTANPPSKYPCLQYCEPSDYPWAEKCGWLWTCGGCPPCL